MKKIAVYTAIFGGYEGLIRQPQFPDIDYLCFTDKPVKARGWKIILSPTEGLDQVRCSRKRKILFHQYLRDYHYSIFIDGNVLLKQHPAPLLEQLSHERPFIGFSHAASGDARHCVYEEYEAILELGRQKKRFKDKPEIMATQIARYREEGYPEQNGLIKSCMLIRKHGQLQLEELMEAWWHEVLNGSKRDQLSFDYVAWKQGFTPYYLHEDARDNTYFKMLGSHRKSYRWKHTRYRLKNWWQAWRKG